MAAAKSWELWNMAAVAIDCDVGRRTLSQEWPTLGSVCAIADVTCADAAIQQSEIDEKHFGVMPMLARLFAHLLGPRPSLRRRWGHFWIARRRRLMLPQRVARGHSRPNCSREQR